MAIVRLRRRTLRRAEARQAVDDARDRLALAERGPGGSPEHPIVVSSPAQIDIRAEAAPCVACDGPVHLRQHDAQDGLRVATIHCTQCGAVRRVWFRLEGMLPH